MHNTHTQGVAMDWAKEKDQENKGKKKQQIIEREEEETSRRPPCSRQLGVHLSSPSLFAQLQLLF